MVLLINTLQRDLRSTNVVEICTALTTVSRVMNAEMIPAILPLVEEKCSHGREIVRKKVCVCVCWNWRPGEHVRPGRCTGGGSTEQEDPPLPTAAACYCA